MADRENAATTGRVAAAANRADGTAADIAHAGTWPLDRLVDYIVQTHHRYLRHSRPAIVKQLEALQLAHGDSHPELEQVAQLFAEMSRELDRHLLKEEQILFPYVRQLAGLGGEHRPDWASPFGTVANPIAMMEREHREAFDALHQIRELTDDYTVPADGGTDYPACMAALAGFEADLERHVQLENMALFPRTLALEKRTVEG